MSKSLRSFDNVTVRKQVIRRRLKEATGGLGYLSALEAAKAYSIQEAEEETEVEQTYVTADEAIGNTGDAT